MLNLNIKVQQVYHEGVTFPTIPQKQTEGSAGYDIVAAIPKKIIISPSESVLIPSGIRLLFSESGYFGLIAARSGLSIKHKITLSNGVGIIDSDYTGEIHIGLTNMSDKEYTVYPKDRIAQILFLPVVNPLMIPVTNFDDVDGDTAVRGDGGFGSTGR